MSQSATSLVDDLALTQIGDISDDMDDQLLLYDVAPSPPTTYYPTTTTAHHMAFSVIDDESTRKSRQIKQKRRTKSPSRTRTSIVEKKTITKQQNTTSTSTSTSTSTTASVKELLTSHELIDVKKKRRVKPDDSISHGQTVILPTSSSTPTFGQARTLGPASSSPSHSTPSSTTLPPDQISTAWSPYRHRFIPQADTPSLSPSPSTSSLPSHPWPKGLTITTESPSHIRSTSIPTLSPSKSHASLRSPTSSTTSDISPTPSPTTLFRKRVRYPPSATLLHVRSLPSLKETTTTTMSTASPITSPSHMHAQSTTSSHPHITPLIFPSHIDTPHLEEEKEHIEDEKEQNDETIMHVKGKKSLNSDHESLRYLIDDYHDKNSSFAIAVDECDRELAEIYTYWREALVKDPHPCPSDQHIEKCCHLLHKLASTPSHYSSLLTSLSSELLSSVYCSNPSYFNQQLPVFLKHEHMLTRIHKIQINRAARERERKEQAEMKILMEKEKMEREQKKKQEQEKKKAEGIKQWEDDDLALLVPGHGQRMRLDDDEPIEDDTHLSVHDASLAIPIVMTHASRSTSATTTPRPLPTAEAPTHALSLPAVAASEHPSYYHVVDSMSHSFSLVADDLSLITRLLLRYSKHDGQQVAVLNHAIWYWASLIKRTIFLIWRKNVSTIKRHRARIEQMVMRWKWQQEKAAVTHLFKIWKDRRLRTTAASLVPQVAHCHRVAKHMDKELANLTASVDAARDQLDRKHQHLQQLSQHGHTLIQQVNESEMNIQTMSNIPFNIVTSYVMKMSQQLITSLVRECQFAQTAYIHDPLKLVDSRYLRSLDRRQELTSELMSISEQELLLTWLNYHITTYHGKPVTVNRFRRVIYTTVHGMEKKDKMVENFSSDLRDILPILELVEQIAPTARAQKACRETKREIDLDGRARKLLSIIYDFDPECANMIQPEQLNHGTTPDLCVAFLGRLFCNHFGIDTNNRLAAILAELAQLQQEWMTCHQQFQDYLFTYQSVKKQYAAHRDMIAVTTSAEAVPFKVQYTKRVDPRQRREEPAVPTASQMESDAIATKQQALEKRQQLVRQKSKKRLKQKIGTPQLSKTPSVDTPNLSKITSVDTPNMSKLNSVDTETSTNASDDESTTADTTTDTTTEADVEESSPERDADEMEANFVQQSQYFAQQSRMLIGKFEKIYHHAKLEMTYAKHSHEVWLRVQNKMRRYILHTLMSHLKKTPITTLDYKAERDLDAFTRLNYEGLKELFIENSPDALAISTELRVRYPELKKIYRHYSAADPSSVRYSMNEVEFIIFIQDCKLTSKTCTRSSLIKLYHSIATLVQRGTKSDLKRQSILEAQQARLVASATVNVAPVSARSRSRSLSPVRGQAASTNATPRSNKSTSTSPLSKSSTLQVPGAAAAARARLRDDTASDLSKLLAETTSIHVHTDSEMELSPSQFVELLLRIAQLKFPNLPTFMDRLNTLLRVHVFRNARRLDTDAFRARFRTPEFIQIFRKYRRQLRRVFVYYSTPIDPNDENSPHCIDHKTFVIMVRTAKLVGADLSLEDVDTIFGNVQKDEFLDGDDGEYAALMINVLEYPDFLESLVALTCFRYPDPYTPLVHRLDVFLGRDLIPILHRFMVGKKFVMSKQNVDWINA